jgi:hypothetical protein
MSVANINITADHVWLASDTLQFDLRGEPHSFATKCSTFPHLYALAGFRGLAQLHHDFDCWMNGIGRVLDVEDAATRLPEQLRRSRDDLCAAYPEHRGEIRGEIFLAGWRPSTKAFGGWHFSSEADFAAAELAVPITSLNPGCADVGYEPPALINNPEQLVRCVEAQKRMSDLNRADGGSELGIGGEVVLVTLSAAGFAIAKRHRFADFAAIKERLRNGR